MVRRFATHVLLFCYGVAVLWGQGLHEFLDDGCERSEQTATAVVVVQSVGPAGAMQSPSGCHDHDCEHCPICQFQALGQHFVAPPPAESGIAVCDIVSPEQESAFCPALFSPAQPRAPPVA
jgi:hypothetical protein